MVFNNTINLMFIQFVTKSICSKSISSLPLIKSIFKEVFFTKVKIFIQFHSFIDVINNRSTSSSSVHSHSKNFEYRFHNSKSEN